jgi:hypothetical protein
MSYVKVSNGQVQHYPYSISQLRKDNPGVSFPQVPSDALLAQYQVFPVATVPAPAVNQTTQSVSEGAPENVGGVWRQTWVVRNASAQELSDRTQAIVSQIKAERERRTLEGGYPVEGKWYHSDTVSRTQQLGLVMMGANLPAGIQWKTMDGSFVAMTPALAQKLFAAATVQDTTTFSVAQQAIAQATANPGSFDMAAIPWPAIYTRP